MTAPLRCTPRASALPASQNTAPVAEFRCLFTHDIRRKQKRWQDGYLKFHSFNNRVMVYDQARNYLGDTYYKDSNELHEGDELNLDKGVMVEVAEAIGVTQTDLTPLFEKKTKESPVRRHIQPQAQPFQKPTPVSSSNLSRPTPQLRHKSLNTLLGTPKGPIGKSVQMQSPFEARKEKENEFVEERPAKRQKTTLQPASRKPSTVVEEQVPMPKKNPLPPARISAPKNMPKPARFIPPAAEIVILEPDSDHTIPNGSDVTLPDTPPRAPQSIAETTVRPVAQKKTAQTPRLPRGKIPLPGKKVIEMPKQPAPGSSPPVSVSNRLSNIDFAVQSPNQRQKEPSPIPSAPQNRKVKSLRLPTGKKRGKLLCQSVPQQAPIGASKAGVKTAKSRPKERVSSRAQTPVSVHGDDSHSQDNTRAAVRRPVLFKIQQKGRNSNEEPASKRARLSASLSPDLIDMFDDPEIVHGILDQQLLLPSSPPMPPQSPEDPPAPVVEEPQSKPTTAKKPTASRKRSAPEPPELEPLKSRSSSPKNKTKKAKTDDQTVGNPSQIGKLSRNLAAALEEPILPRQNVSRAQSPASAISSRRSSISPTKKALSTGGFPKRPPKKSALAKQGSEVPVLAQPRNESVPLPPHPLISAKKGPVMDSTELAAVLQKPKGSKRAPNDQAKGSTHSPNRNLRRVQSENDAPIPSTAEDWEKKNLPKTSSTLTEEDAIQPAIADSGTSTTATTATTAATALTRAPLTTTNSTTSTTRKKSTSLSALIKRTDPQRKKLNRTQSLMVETNIPPARDPEAVSPPVISDTDVGPWSTEAFDLMDWRPPGR